MLTQRRDTPGRRPAHIEICGTLLAEIDGRRVDPVLPGRKGRQLFACLVIGRERPMSRDELIDVLWPDDSPADPDGAFSTLLTRLRTALGPGVPLGRGELVLDLGDDAWIDWEIARESLGDAEACLAAGDARRALEVASRGLGIARRPFLSGMSTRWIEDRRRELVEWHAGLLETAGRAALQLGGEHLPAAERSARELIDREPCRESAYVLLMEVHSARGNIAEALRVFDDVRRLLREELGLTPAPALTTLASRLLEERDEPVATTTAKPSGTPDDAPAPSCLPAVAPLPPGLAAVAGRPLAGRERELGHVLGAIVHAPSDTCRVVAVTGEAGIGKTRFVGEVAARAHAAGCEVMHGRAQAHGVTPYQPFVEALRHHLAHSDAVVHELAVLRPELAELARLVPELRAVAPVPAEERAISEGPCPHVFAAVGALFDAIARRRRLVLVLDDLQWADQSTLLLLRHVVHAAQSAPMTVLATVRNDEPSTPDLRGVMVDLDRERVLERIALRELDEVETAQLVSAHIDGAAHPAAVRSILAQTSGNPFLVEELVREEPADGSVPAGVRDAVESRLERLPASARRVLAVAASTGCSFDLTTVSRHADAPRAAMRDGLTHAVRTGLLVAEAGRPEQFSFRHEVVRRALLAR